MVYLKEIHLGGKGGGHDTRVLSTVTFAGSEGRYLNEWYLHSVMYVVDSMFLILTLYWKGVNNLSELATGCMDLNTW